jgi:hypothetical protein
VTPSLSPLYEDSTEDSTEDSIAKRPELFPSPVLMTVVEQLSVLVKKEPFSVGPLLTIGLHSPPNLQTCPEDAEPVVHPSDYGEGG